MRIPLPQIQKCHTILEEPYSRARTRATKRQWCLGKRSDRNCWCCPLTIAAFAARFTAVLVGGSEYRIVVRVV